MRHTGRTHDDPRLKLTGYPGFTHADIDRPSTWTRYRAGLCDGCHARCCTLPVEADPQDLVRMGLLTDDEIHDGGLKKAARRLTKEGIVRSYRDKTRLFTLSQRPNGDCVYLGAADRRCTIYATRPDVCRRFPEIGPRPGHCPAKKALPARRE